MPRMANQLLVAALAWTALACPAAAFDTGHHFDLTRSALAAEGFSRAATRHVQVGNWVTDYLNVPEVYAFSNSLNPVQSTSFNSQMRVLSAYYSLDATLGRYATVSTTGRVDRSSAFQTPTSYFYPSVSLSSVLSDYVALPTAISF